MNQEQSQKLSGLPTQLRNTADCVERFLNGYRPTAAEVDSWPAILGWNTEPGERSVIWGKLLGPHRTEFGDEEIAWMTEAYFYIDIENNWVLTLRGFMRLLKYPKGPRTDAFTKRMSECSR